MNVDEVRAQFRSDLENAANAPVEQLSADAITWLGLAPEWSVALADAAGFPIGSTSHATTADWLKAAVASGICRVSEPQPYSGDRSDRFWMPDPGRSPVFSAALERVGSPIDHLTEVARSVERALKRERFVWAESLRPWVALATTSPYDAGTDLLQRVRYLVREGDLHGAHRWIVAAQRLAPIMGPGLGSSLRRAQRHIALHHRQRHDEAVLRDYIPRPDLAGSFDDLLASESTWALHYLGDGGVGKTSLLRMLTAERTRRPEELLFARVDFDHVSPEYPWRRPAQLLSLLADELEISALSAGQQRSLDEFRRSERRTSEVGSASDSVMSLDSKEFNRALEDFADFLERLPGRAVLVLDTCEELAKFHEPGEPVAAVDCTFTILERLHELAPSTRVVFAGRRLLTRGGADTAGWRTTIRHRARAPAGERPYLDLCHVRGFSKEQAEQFLVERKSIESPSIRDAIMIATEELDDDGDARYNPFDVALYAAWAADDASLIADDIRDDGGLRYVEQRVVGRLEPELADVIPILVVLGGRATPDLLTQACGSRLRADAMHARLRLQEWVDPVATSMGEVLVVQPRLLARFRTFVRLSAIGSPRLVVASVEERLRHAFEDGMADRPSELSPTTAVVAFGLVDADRARALWERLEVAADEHDEWNELQRLASVLLANPAEGGLPDSAAELRSLVSKSYATATAQTGGSRRQILDRLGPTASADAAWPPPTVGADSTVRSERELVERDISGFVDRYLVPLSTTDSAVGRFVTDLETVLDEAVRHGADISPLTRVLADIDLDGRGSEIELYLLALLARWRILVGGVREATALFDRAERALAQQSGPPTGSNPGWVRPDPPIDRVRLMYAEAAVVLGIDDHLAGETMRRWYRDACERSDTIDGNRLAARLLVISTEIVDVPFIDPAAPKCDLLGPNSWTLALHDRVPPLIGAVAIAEAAAGRLTQSRERLSDAKRQLARSDEQMRRAIELVELRLSIVDGQEVDGRIETLAREDDDRAPLAAAWLAIYRERFGTDAGLLTVHERWRTSGPVRTAERFVAGLERQLVTADGIDLDEIRLDLDEAERLGLTEMSVRGPSADDLRGPHRQPPGASGPFDTVSWERRVRCDLRREALGGGSPSHRNRRVADLASEEGVLVAHRLPDVAVSLHDVAEMISAADTVRPLVKTTPLQARLGSVALTAKQHRPRSRFRRAVGARLRRSLPFLLLILAFAAMTFVSNRAPAGPSSALDQFLVIFGVLGFYVAVFWMFGGRRLVRWAVGLLMPFWRWPYWVAWRVELTSARSGTVSLRPAERDDGGALAFARRLRLSSSDSASWGARLFIRGLRRRLPDWKFAVVPSVEPFGDEQQPGGPPSSWWNAIERRSGPIGVEIVTEYEDEFRPIERVFAQRFGCDADTPEMVFFRRSSTKERRPGHPRRRSVRRAGVRVVASGPVELTIADCWSSVRVRTAPAQFDDTGVLEVSPATTVHVVGNPYESSAGWVVELEHEQYAESAPTRAPHRWFGPPSLLGSKPPRLVVLQPTPAIEVGAVADARETAGFRHVARSLRSIGCPVVIVLPVVSARIADELASCLAGLVADHRLDRLRLMDISVRVRQFLAERLVGEHVEGGASGAVSDFTIYTNR